MADGACSCTSGRHGWTQDVATNEFVCAVCRRPSQATIDLRVPTLSGSFFHSRVASQYDPLMGAVRFKDLITQAKADDLQHVCISDHGTMHGAYAFQKAVLAAGLTPIHAVQYPGAVLIAVTDEGLSNLIAACSAAQMDMPPPQSMLGVVIATADRTTDEEIASLKQAYTKVMIELPVGREDEWDDLAAIATRHHLPLLPTADVRFSTFEQRLDYLLLVAIREKKKLDDVQDAPGYHLLDVAEMVDRYADYPEVWEGMSWLLGHEFPLIEHVDGLWPKVSETPVETLRSEVEKGIGRRYPDGETPEIRERIEYELRVITQMDFPNYFLMLQELTDWCSRVGIYTNTRGSAAGSIVSFLLGITHLDPIKHRMLFERFLNEGRKSPPDVDLDISQERRDEVIQHLRERWGQDGGIHVCQIGTVNGFNAKGSLRDVTRVLGLSYGLGDRLSSMVPPMLQGFDVSLRECFDPEHDRYEESSALREAADSDLDAAAVIEHALLLDGLTRQTGVHPAGVIVSIADISNIAPLMKREGRVVSQWYWGYTEARGLLKMDALGLRNLDILAKAVTMIEESIGERIDPHTIPLEDPKTFELLRRADTLGTFQLDGQGMRSLLRNLQADKFEDLPACVALYRPGPMSVQSHVVYARRKNSLEEITPIHPELTEVLEPILGGTYGVIVYQEHVLEIAKAVAGYSLADADILRRAIGKKDPELMASERGHFAEGAAANGYSTEAIEAVWAAIVGNSAYSFNRAHAVSYGWLAMVTAYLKTHYPTQFMAAVLSTTADKKDRTALYLQECRRMGLQVSPPDVRLSEVGYSVAGADAIRVGIGSIQGIGLETAKTIVGQRDPACPNLFAWASRMSSGIIAKRAMEALAKAGAFCGFGLPRKGLLEALPTLLPVLKAAAIAAQHGLVLFPSDAPSITVAPGEYSRTEILALEKASFGLYVSDHPLSVLAQDIAALASHSIGELGALEDKDRVRIAGMVTTLLRKTTKAGNRPWAILQVEDLDGDVEALVFPNSWEAVSGFLREGSIVVLDGRVSRRDGGLSVIPDTISILDGSAEGPPVVLRLPARLVTTETVEDILLVAQKYPGEAPLEVAVVERGKWALVQIAKVRSCPPLLLELKSVFGPRVVRVG